MPVESPTVPNADTTSNSSWMKVHSGSSTHIRKVAMHTTRHGEHGDDAGFGHVLLGNTPAERPDGPLGAHAPHRLQDHEEGTGLDTASGGSRGCTDEHQHAEHKQTRVGEVPDGVGGKSRRSGGHAVEKRPHPSHILRQLQENRSHRQKSDGGGDHRLGVQGQPVEVPRLQNIQNHQEAQASEDDQETGGHVQQDIRLIGDQVPQPAQNVKARVVEGRDGVEHADSQGVHRVVILGEYDEAENGPHRLKAEGHEEHCPSPGGRCRRSCPHSAPPSPAGGCGCSPRRPAAMIRPTPTDVTPRPPIWISAATTPWPKAVK